MQSIFLTVIILELCLFCCDIIRILLYFKELGAL
ncbi:hypothetical protein X975_02975, partial [Stegodyphus mimosarum]